MSAPVRRFDAAFVSSNWYNRSLSEKLSNLNRNFKAKFPAEFAVIFAEAAASVYAHESLMHQYLKTTAAHEPIHPNPNFVYEGYRKALQPLIDVLEDQQAHAQNATVRGFRDSLLSELHVMLVKWSAESISKIFYYQNKTV